MALIDTLVKSNITLATQTVPVVSFSIPLIIGPTTVSWSTSDIVRSYTDPAAMLEDGFTTSEPEYKYAVEMYEQAITPSEFFVGHRTTAVTQVDTITPTAVNATHYIVTIDTVPYDFLSDADATVMEIVAGLIALINADPNVSVIATGTTTLILTSKAPGLGFITSVNANMALVHTTLNNGIVDDLVKIIGKNNTWYGIVLCSNVASDIEQLAAAVEPLKKIYISASADTAIGTSSTTDVLSILKGKSYNRTGLVFSPESANDGIDAAWVGGQLPAVPGSNNWAYKTLAGITPDTLSDNQVGIVIGDPIAQVAGKNGNVYVVVGGVAITMMGQMASGRYIDIQIGIDWLESTIQTNVFSALVSAAKIPYTDKGTDVLIQAVQSALLTGVSNGLIDGNSPITVTAPKVLTIPVQQRANRVAPTISYTCRLAGAINAVDIEGTVSI